jgi:hypothetical protein
MLGAALDGWPRSDGPRADQDLRMGHESGKFKPADLRMLAGGGVVRCPHCRGRVRVDADGYARGGEVGGEGGNVGRAFNRGHEGAMRHAARTRTYDRDFDHYYEEGEAGYARGGRIEGRHSDPRMCAYLAAGRECRHQL